MPFEFLVRVFDRTPCSEDEKRAETRHKITDYCCRIARKPHCVRRVISDSETESARPFAGPLAE